MPQVIAFIAGSIGVSAAAATGVGIAVGSGTAFAAGAAFASTLVGSIVVGLGETLVFSELSKALTPTSHANVNQKPVGVQIQSTVGENQPEGFVVGRSATAGWMPAPDMTHGTSGQVPNAYLTQVRELSSVAGCTLSRVFVGGEVVTLGPDDGSGYGQPATGKYAGKLWIKYYDGSQTAADPMLVSKYGSDPNRPWTSDMIFTGICYAIATFLLDRNVYPGAPPSILYELDGIPLYDPRFDSTVGGTGSQAWGAPSTYAQTQNPMVIAYNIFRGMQVGTQSWGGLSTADGLPLSEWFAAMNACDATVTNGDGSTEAAYRCGYFVTVDMKPQDVLDEIKKAAAAEFAEVGGKFKPRVGPPGLPVYMFTDDDIIISSPDDLSPFPGLESTYNAVSASYPDPDSIWQSKAAPLRVDSAAVTADQGRQLQADLQLHACPFPNQVQRLQDALLKDNRRFLQHHLTLPPDAAFVEPLDAVEWTSDRMGYSGKVFEVGQSIDEQQSCLQTFLLRERDGTDYDWSPSYQLPTTAPASTTVALPGAQTLAAWAVTGVTVPDTLGLRDLSAIKVSWNDPGSEDVQAILIEVEDATGALVSSSRYDSVANGFAIITDGIIGGNDYSARGKVVPYSGRATSWSSLLTATAPTVAYPATAPAANFWDSVTALEAAAATGGILAVSALTDVTTPVSDQMVLKLPEILLYQWNATAGAWAPVASMIATGQVIASMIAAGAVTADKVSVGALNALSAVINGALTINGASGAFLFGKSSANDFSTDGAFMGQTLNADATTTFGMLMGRTSASGTLQYLQNTKDAGLNLVNANFSKLLPSSTSNVTVTTSQTVTLPAGTQTISLMLLGGGGAGGPSGGSGGASVVKLFDGATDTGVSWTSTGGAGGGSSSGNGQSSPYGTGGASAGSGTNPAHDSPPITYGALAATGYGAGGGGGSDGFDSNGYMIVASGGAAAVPVGVSQYDVSALANPKLVITVGGKGVHTNSYAADGSQGLVKYSTFSSALVPVAPVPPRPTATGSFSNTATSFPDLGAGIWVLSNFTNGQGLQMGIGTDNGDVRIWEASSGIVISGTTPTITGRGSTETIDYLFYSMSQAT